MKKIIGLILVLTLTMGMSVMAFAEETDVKETYAEDTNDYSHELWDLEGGEKTERWAYVSSTSQYLTIDSSGKATVTARVAGINGVYKITLYMYLQQYKDGTWNNLASWTATENEQYILKEYTYSTCPKGYTYRLRCSAYAYKGNKFEHIIFYTSEKKY